MPVDIKQLREVPFFDIFPKDSALLQFIKSGAWEKYQSAASIYRAGDPANNICVLVVGSVRISRNKRSLADIRPNELFGEVSPILRYDRTVDAVAVKDSIVFKFSMDALEAVALEIRYLLMKYIYETTATRLLTTTSKIVIT